MSAAQAIARVREPLDYGARIRRAQVLACEYPFAAEFLRFYGHVSELQQQLYSQLSAKHEPVSAATVGELRRNTNLVLLRPHLIGFLKRIQRFAPQPAADAAGDLISSSQAFELLNNFWTSGKSAAPPDTTREKLCEFLLLAFSQPYAELLAAQLPMPHLVTESRTCPRCGSQPLLGVLRPEGDGGKRRLMCSFCLQEWDFRRIFCAACGESEEQKLPVYVAEAFPHIRVECCDTCNFYLRTIDLTRNGNAVPIVDDLAAIPLSLWAQEHGYRRLQENLLGT